MLRPALPRALLLSAARLAPLAFAVSLVACSSDDGGPPVLPPPADASASASTSAAEKKKDGEQGCNSNEECESNNCFAGNKQRFCTVPCNAENAVIVCVAPFTGTCNNRGFCKRD